jgi:hypothetical protein
MIDYDRVIYSINVEDVQNVAVQNFGRELTENEVSVIAEEIGDYIKWNEAIMFTIMQHLAIPLTAESE